MESPEIVVTDIAAEPIWLLPDALNVRGQRKGQLRDLIEVLKSRQGASQAVADVLLGKPGEVPDPLTGMRTLVAEIIAELPKESQDATLSLLGRMVYCRNGVHAPPLPLPEIPVRMPRPVPPFTPDRWGGLAKYRAWSAAVLDDIVRSRARSKAGGGNDSAGGPRPDDLRTRIARVLESAVLWGGILCRKDLESVYRSLPRWPEVSEYTHDRVYVTWFDEAANCRRWMPDVITALLMMQLRPAELPQVAAIYASRRLDRILEDYFKVIFADHDSRPSVFYFIDTCLLHFELRLPPYLTRYAAGKLPSVSPNPATWARMVGRPGPSPATATEQSADRRADDPVDDNKDDEPELCDIDEDDWVSRLRNLLGAGDAKLSTSGSLGNVKQRMQSHSVSAEEALFLAFAADMLEERRGNRLRSIRSLVLGVAQSLPAVVSLDHPATVSPDTLASGYSLILEDTISPSQHRKLRGYLRSWHRWLVRTDRSQRIDETEVFGTSGKLQTIDARLIMEDEYLQARDSLVDESMNFGDDPRGQKELRHIAGLILILGYRCGLRKYEVLKAQLDALLLAFPAEFLVRPWSERALKTPNAVRKLPLYALLDNKELKLLSDWMKHRREQNDKTLDPSPFLFFMPALERRFIPEGRIFPLIHEELRAATGDETVHFHTLRKSGAGTWLAFTLLRPQSVPLPKWLDCWPAQKKRIEEGKPGQEQGQEPGRKPGQEPGQKPGQEPGQEPGRKPGQEVGRKRAKMHKRLYSNEYVTRRDLFAVARTLGHSSPGVSVANYLELQSDLLALWLDTVRPELKSKHIQAIAEVSAATVSGCQKEDIHQQLWALIGRRRKEVGIPTEVPGTIVASATEHESEQPLSIREQFEKDAPSEIPELEEVLLAHSEGASRKNLIWRSGYPKGFLDALLDAAGSAAQLKVAEKPAGEARGSVDYVHSFRANSAGERIVCPMPIRTAEDLTVIRRFGPRLFRTLGNERESFISIARHWLKIRRNERNGLEFSPHDSELAGSYIKILSQLNVAPDETSVRHFGTSEQAAAWKKFLGEEWWRRLEPARPPSPCSWLLPMKLRMIQHRAYMAGGI